MSDPDGLWEQVNSESYTTWIVYSQIVWDSSDTELQVTYWQNYFQFQKIFRPQHKPVSEEYEDDSHSSLPSSPCWAKDRKI